jgi:hypothetical protein
MVYTALIWQRMQVLHLKSSIHSIQPLEATVEDFGVDMPIVWLLAIRSHCSTREPLFQGESEKSSELC